MSLSHLLRRLCTTTATTTRSPISISFLHQRIHNISNSPEYGDPETTNTGNDQDLETKPRPTLIPANGPSQFQIPQNHIPPIPYPPILQRTLAFSSSAEGAASERRRKHRLRIEPPLHALRRDPLAPPPKRVPNAPRLLDSTSALVDQRRNLHSTIQSLIRASDLDAASDLARQSVFSNTPPTVSTCNAIIAAMHRAKRYSESISLFQYFFKQYNIVPNVVSCNHIINAHCDEGHVEEALEMYRHILANAPFAPSSVTYRHLTKGLVQAGRIGDAASLLREMLSKGQAADSMVYNNLIKGHLDLDDLDKANEFFDELKSQRIVYDGIVHATFMEFWFQKGNDKEAMKSYMSLLDKKFRMHPRTGNALLEVFLKYGKKTEAWALFNEMLDNHSPPNICSVNSGTVSIMVNECFKMGQFSEAINTFKKVGSKPTSKPFMMDYVGYRNIVTRFCEQGMLTEAERFFAECVSKSLPADAPTYRAMIDAYLKEKRYDDALKMFNRMVDVNLRVVADFATRVFDELIINGKIVESDDILTKIREMEPKPDPLICPAVIGLYYKKIFSELPPPFDKFVQSWANQTPWDRPPNLSWSNGTAGQAVGGTYKANNGQNSSWSGTLVNQQQHLWSSQAAGQHLPTWSSKAPGYQQQQSWSQHQGWPSPSGHLRQGWSSPSGHQHSWANQTLGQQKPWANQAPGGKQQWGNQNTGHLQSWANEQQPV